MKLLGRADKSVTIQPVSLPHPNPGTAVEVQANRRHLLQSRGGYQKILNLVFIAVVVAIALAGAAGSIYNITDAAKHYDRSAWIGWTSWAGAEGTLIISAAVGVAASWRGQTTPLWSRVAMWAAAGYAVYLNLSAPGSTPAGEAALLVGSPIGTALGVEGMAWNARSLLLMLTGAEQHQAEVEQRRKLVRAHRWASRARTWEANAVRGGIARWRARNYADEMAVDDPSVIEEMRANLTAFVVADSFRPAPAPVELERADTLVEVAHEAVADTRPEEIEGPLEHPALPPGPVSPNTAPAVNAAAWKGGEKDAASPFVAVSTKPQVVYPPSSVNGVRAQVPSEQETPALVPAKEIPEEIVPDVAAVPAKVTAPVLAAGAATPRPTVRARVQGGTAPAARRRPTLTHEERVEAITQAFPGNGLLSVYQARQEVSGRDDAVRAALVELGRWRGDARN
ncbi:DUF2637 domain-containing protein [Streptomyces sp. NPDC056401]|uniref:DUF2637 domain-containing protein n=1 Tax=Streptomyces sp. NPDC056401 TaxID=3345809 RepID=UPI0035DA10D7